MDRFIVLYTHPESSSYRVKESPVFEDWDSANAHAMRLIDMGIGMVHAWVEPIKTSGAV